MVLIHGRKLKKKLLNEDPNEVSRNPETGRGTLKWSNPFAITFILFDDYFVYAPTAKGAMHNDLAHWLSFKVLAPKMLKNFELYNPWSGAIKEVGLINRKAVKTMNSAVKLMDSGLDGRNALLKTNPEVILGRLWANKNVISFWNYLPYVFKASNHIFNFISIFGDPSKFEYDVRNMEVKYENILNKKLSGEQN